MKFLPLLLAAALTAHAAPSEPGKTAIDFLEKVRLRKLNLEPGGDTALSAQTAVEKKRQIARLLERLASDLGSDPLEVGSVKLDENFAAVLVRKSGGFDPSRLRVFPLALVKRDAEWRVAPVPGSFENAGAGYATTLRKRLELLENWMLREQVVALEHLREQAAAHMREKIELSLTAKELRSYDSKQLGERFLAACERKDLPGVLGFLGGLAAKLPDDWPVRLKSADRALDPRSQATRSWRLLTAPEVLRVLVHHEETNDNGFISIACLDPAGNGTESASPRLEAIQFDLSKDRDGLWQINPPTLFLQDTAAAADELNDAVDSDLITEFPAKWTASHPPAPQATAERARQALIAALGAENPQALLSLLKLDAGSAAAGNACIQAAQMWWSVRHPAAVCHPLPLAFQADESSAVAVFQFFSAKTPERLNPQVFYFEKSAAGWLWTPQAATGTTEKFKAWMDSETKRWPNQWQQTLLNNSPLLEMIDGGQAPTKDDAAKIVGDWLDATRRGDIQNALACVARLSDPHSGSTALKNLSYEIIGSRRGTNKPEIIGIYQGKIWTAVGVKIDQAGKSIHPLYPLITTPQGPRILVEIDLFAAKNRSREFLNRAAFERLEKFSSAAATSELKALYSEHQTHVEAMADKAPR